MTPGLFAVTVVGRDRPGIVAAVARALYEHGCNLEDATSTILRGHFSMVLIVGAPAKEPAEVLREAISAELGEGVVTVAPVEDAHGRVTQPTHMVSVYGADRPGIVLSVTDVLVQGGANITDLTSRVLGDDAAPIYSLMLEVVLPSALESRVVELGDELGVNITVHPIEPDIL